MAIYVCFRDLRKVSKEHQMKFKIISIFVFFAILKSNFVYGDLTTAKYAGEFMSVGVGARALAMGGAYAAASEDVTAIYWNPAGLTSIHSFQIHGMHAERFGGIVNWDFLGLGFSVKDSLAIGLGLYRLGVDDIPITRLTDPSKPLGAENLPQVEKYINDSEMVLMFSFGKKQSRSFSYGGSIKAIRKSMDEWGAWGIGFDFGVLWNPIQQLKIGAVLMDGTSTLIAWNTGRTELLLPHFRLGAVYPVQFYSVKVLPICEIDVDFESRGKTAQMSLGPLGLDLHAGGEISYKDRLFFRAGTDRGSFTVGGGFWFKYFQVDYGFLNHFDLGHTHRISLTILLNKPIPLKF